jgi:predicted DNA-binding protein
MQDVSIRFNEELGKRGKRLQDAEAEEAADLLREAME